MFNSGVSGAFTSCEEGTGIISRFQFFLLAVNFILGTTLFVQIQILIEQGKQDAWLMPWWAGAFGIAASLVWIVLHRHYPGKSLAQIPILALGRPLGMAISMLYFLHFCILAGWVLRNLSDFLNGTIMPQTPGVVFYVMFLFVAAFTVAQGVETVARLNQFVTPFLFFPFWFVLLLASKDWSWDRFQPALHTDIWGTILHNHSFLGFPFMETLTLMMFFPHIQKDGAGRSLILGIAAGAVSLSLILYMLIGLLGVERASKLTYPVYTVVQEVSLGEVVENIHSIISVVLLILIFIKTLVLVYGAHALLNQVFRTETNWPFYLAISVLMAASAESIYVNPIQNNEWSSHYTFVYDTFFALVIPGVLLAATRVKNAVQKGRKR